MNTLFDDRERARLATLERITAQLLNDVKMMQDRIARLEHAESTPGNSGKDKTR